MSNWVEQLVTGMGYLGIGLLTLIENLFPPIPSELITPLGGFKVAQGELNMVGVIAAGTTGSVVGAVVLYYVGRSFNQERLERWADRYGGWLLLTRSDVHSAFEWFDRHGGMAVFLCRLIPGVRSLISIPAGACRMPLMKFLAYTAVGTAIWTSALAYAGLALGQQYQDIGTVVQWLTYAVIALTVISIVWWFIQKRREQSQSEQGQSEQ